MTQTLIKNSKGYFIVSTVELFEWKQQGRGPKYETMVFKEDKSGEIKKWLELDRETYKTKRDSERGHQRMIKKWEAM